MKKLAVSLTVLVVGLMAGVSTAQASIFTVWADTTNDGVKDLYLGQISSYSGNLSAANNYNYFSGSGHPVNGPTPSDYAAELFVFENLNNNRFFLNVIAGKDNASHSATQKLNADIDITGSLLNPVRKLRDDSSELKEPSADHFEGRWTFKKNSDGGVIGPLTGNWEAKITPVGRNTMHTHAVYSADGSVISLDNIDAQHYFLSTAAPVPEPASMLLLGSGLLGLVGFVRKRS